MSGGETPSGIHAGLILRAENLTIGYEKPLASNLNLNVNSGEIISIVGPSGVGKTTLLRTCLLYTSPSPRD